MNKWRPGYGTRTLLCHEGAWFTFRSDHPLEERIVELTEDYRDEHGNFILPEAVAWDGVTSFEDQA